MKKLNQSISTTRNNIKLKKILSHPLPVGFFFVSLLEITLIMVLSDEQKKSTDILVKVLNKKYPYIVGVEVVMSDFTEYKTLINFNLKFNKDKIETYFKRKTDYNHKYFWRFGNLWCMSNVQDGMELIITEIQEDCDLFYKSLGCECQFNTGWENDGNYRTVKFITFILEQDIN
jgi:hypothetical protein